MASYLDRILDDGTDRERWKRKRRPRIGASDAARFANINSVDRYVAEKLKDREFAGNKYTAAGHDWEEDLLAWAGVDPNKLFIHAEENEQYAATPDGLTVTPSGIILGEVKIKHNKIVSGPTAAEKRQVAWQQFCVGPEVLYTEWVWGELLPNGRLRDRGAQRIRIYPADVADILADVLTIAVPFLGELNRALEYERQVTQ